MSDRARAIFLDRDGVINRLLLERGPRETPRRPEEFELLPGVHEALTSLRRTDALLIVATNQPNVAKGNTSLEHHAAIEQRLHQLLGEGTLDAVYTCLHRAEDNCPCRKPKPGLLLQAAADHNIDLKHSIMIGDSASDVAAGRAAGCRTILLQPTASLASGGADAVASDLLAAVPYVLHLLHENIY